MDAGTALRFRGIAKFGDSFLECEDEEPAMNEPSYAAPEYQCVRCRALLNVSAVQLYQNGKPTMWTTLCGECLLKLVERIDEFLGEPK